MQQRDIIVIGASAGSLFPLIALANGLPLDFGASIFIAQHYPRGERSELPVLLSRNGALEASEAVDGEPIRKGHIYTGPSDRQLLLAFQTVVLEYPVSQNRFRPTIDALFHCAADTFGGRVIGIILSGSLSDGAKGLAAVKDAGGISVVQKPSDAKFSSMPESAIRFRDVDYVLPARDMSALLAALVRYPKP